MSSKTASLLGATGMTGDYLLDLLLQDDYYDRVKVITRKPLEKIHPKMEVKLVDFENTESLKLALEESHTIFCCIGTTRKKVKGDLELYRKIDYDIPLNAARLGKETGCENFVVITSVGASRRSSAFYLKLKGELEDSIHSLHIRSVHIMQPSMLLGSRKEKRTAEKWVNGLLASMPGLFRGSFKKFRPIHGKMLTRAMLQAGKSGRQGFYRYTYDDIIAMANQ